MSFVPPQPIPATPGGVDLSDADLDRLEALLSDAPEPLEPLDLVMLDGYLCGLIAQPLLREPAEWLAGVYDLEGRPLPEGVDPTWRERVDALVLKRYQALNRAIVEDGAFDPIVGAPDEDATEAEADAAGVPEASLPLMPWAAGFLHAQTLFPDLSESDDDHVGLLLARVYRHLPADEDEPAELAQTLSREWPVADFDDAVEDLVDAVVELADRVRDERFHVPTVRRDAPKVGRNDPCPCGSGRKFKQCCGA